MRKRIIFFFLSSFYFVLIADPVNFPVQGHCVAWKTSKRLFLFKNESPEGINCKIQTYIEKDAKGFRFQGIFPIEGFQSGNEIRDKQVRELLEESVQANLLFTSEVISLADWRLKNNTSFSMKGVLLRGKKPYTVLFEVKKDTKNGLRSWSGLAITSFTAMGMEAPSVAGGVVTKVNDFLELQFLFQENKILNLPE